MSSLPPPFSPDSTILTADRALNARFTDYLDAVFPAREHRRRLRLSGYILALSLAVLIGAVIAGFYLPFLWSVAALAALAALRSVRVMRRMQRTERYYERVRDVARDGTLVSAYVVQAAEDLYRPGTETLPCRALFSFEPEVGGDADYMRYLARRIVRLKDTVPSDPEGRYLARLAVDEEAVPYRRRPLPVSFTDGSTVYCADLFVKRAYLDTPYLTTDVLPCLAEPGDSGGIEMVPTWLLASPAAASSSSARPESGSGSRS